MGLYIGVDPGSQGALCLLDLRQTNRSITFTDIPPRTTGKKFLLWLEDNLPSGDQVVGLEDVHSLPGMTAKSNFNFGRNLGKVEITLEASGLTIVPVQPKKWQSVVGIKFPKGTKPPEKKKITAARALILYPEAELYGPRGGLRDGRADALMIAHYMSMEHKDGN